MEKSEKFGFNLPSSNNDDIADINQISDNFRIIDNKALTNEELQSILSKELENKMDKFGSVFFLANGIDPSKKDKTYLGIDSPELILSRIIEESGEDTSVILKGVSTPSNASNDVVANKGYVDELFKNIDISGIDVSGKMDKFGEVSTEGNTVTVDVGSGGKNFIFYGNANAFEINSAIARINCGVFDLISGGNEVISADNGNLKLRRLIAPTDDTDAVNKMYVDDKVGSIETALDSIIAIQNSILGGGA